MHEVSIDGDIQLRCACLVEMSDDLITQNDWIKQTTENNINDSDAAYGEDTSMSSCNEWLPV